MCDSFREYMAPNELKGRRLVGPDQAMMEAQDRIQEHNKAQEGQPVVFSSPGEWKQFEHDYKAMDRFNKRKERGGSIFKAGHIIG